MTSARTPFLHVDVPQSTVRAVVLVLHGGQEHGTAPTTALQPAVVRMMPFVASLRRAGRGRGLAVARLRYRVRGWNGSEQSPVADVRWALDQLAARFPDMPLALVGHSMGGRAAVHAAGHAGVRAVVGLAPWIEPGDPFRQLAGRDLLVVHGTNDGTTSPDGSLAYARDAATVGASVGYVAVRHERHAMLLRPGLWHQLATGYVLAVMCDTPPNGTVRRSAANVLQKVKMGSLTVTV